MVKTCARSSLHLKVLLSFIFISRVALFYVNSLNIISESVWNAHSLFLWKVYCSPQFSVLIPTGITFF